METQLFITLAGIHLLALMSPGPDFALMLTKATGPRASALAAAAGISVAILVHTLLSLSGISLIIQNSPTLFTLVKVAGSLYLGWMGVSMLRAGLTPSIAPADDESVAIASGRNDFMQGFYTNMLNPKALVFFLTLFSSLVSIDASWGDKLIICIIMFGLSFAWFGLLAFGLTSGGLHAWLKRKTCLLNNLSGILFVVVAISILANLLIQ